MKDFTIYRKNGVFFKPGGYYLLGEGNETEERVARLHLLQQMVNLMVNDICDCAENRVIMAEEVEALADQLFEKFRPAIEAGFTELTELRDFYEPKTLERYLKREVVGGISNAGPDEGEKDLPPGWWYDFPGNIHKSFYFGEVYIDIDVHVRIMTCDHGQLAYSNPRDCLEIQGLHEVYKIRDKFPDNATEIIKAVIWILNNR